MGVMENKITSDKIIDRIKINGFEKAMLETLVAVYIYIYISCIVF